MSKITQLPDGTWIDLEDIVRIHALQKLDPPPKGQFYLPGSGLTDKPSVKIEFRSKSDLFVPCESFEKAIALRDEMAATVNRHGERAEALAATARTG